MKTLFFAPRWGFEREEFDAYCGRIAEMMTITTEFGPPPYTPSAPYTQEPLADQWELNIHFLQRLKNRF